MSRWRRFRDAFLPNEQNRRMFLGALAFFVALVGAAIGFSGWSLESKAIQFVGFVIVAGAVGAAVIAQLWLAWRLYGRGEWRKEMTPPSRAKQPWE